MDIAFLTDTLSKLLAALPTTLALFSLSITLGGILALGVVWMRVSRNPVLQRFAAAYIFVFRGSPLMIQMFLVYYGLSQFPEVRHSFAWPVLKDAFACAVISLALCTAGYTAEIFRGGLLAVPAREIEAAPATEMDRPAGGGEVFHRNRADAEVDSARQPRDGLGSHRRRATHHLADLPDDGGLPLRRRDLPDPQLHHRAAVRPSRIPAVAASTAGKASRTPPDRIGDALMTAPSVPARTTGWARGSW